ncbi:ATP-binding cassette domain-containing protein [Malacoplasma penetrans]|uniref:ATP-binding cassette domain-containing protein n=1 Tax=Malacoplasma penetrans TaxID=28227 RepID=UPI00197C1A92
MQKEIMSENIKNNTNVNLSKDIIMEVNNLTCKFNENQSNEITAIDDFSFSFERNKIYFIIGNSGSGKSTLVTHFNGLLKSKKGTIRIEDFYIKPKPKKIKNAKKLRRLVSMVFQFPEYQLFKTTIEKDISFGPIALKIPKIRSNEINKEKLDYELFFKYIYEIKQQFNITNSEYKDFNDFISQNNLSLKYKIYPKKDFAKITITNNSNKSKWKKVIKYETLTEGDFIHELTKKHLVGMGLDESFLDRSPFGLSGGQKRRVAIAGILAIQPKILIFDEPTAGLDPKGEQMMMDLILDSKKQGQTVIVITHTMDQVLEVGDYAIVMDRGKILMHGTPYEIFTNKDLYTLSKMEKPKIIDFIDSLCEKDPKYKELYNKEPRTIEQLSEEIQKINSGSGSNKAKSRISKK